MKTKKRLLALFIIIPIVILYLIFSFALWELDISKWWGGRIVIILICLFILFIQWMFLFVTDSHINNFQDFFQYDEQEEREKEREDMRDLNTHIKEMNKLAREQLIIIKENKAIINELDNIK